MKGQTPNPAGREGKPISLAPMSFDDALRKILGAKPPTKLKSKPTKKKKKTAKKKKPKPAKGIVEVRVWQ